MENDLLELLDQYYADNHLEDAEKFLLEQIRIHTPCCMKYDPLYVTAFNELGSLYRNMGQYKKSISAFQKALECIQAFAGKAAPDLAVIFINIAGSYRLMGEFDTAIQFYLNAEQILLQNAPEEDYRINSLRNNLAIAYMENKEYTKAIHILRTLLSSLTGDMACSAEAAISYCNLAGCYLLSGDHKTFLIWINRSLSLFKELDQGRHPHYPAALNMMANYLASQGQFKESQPYYKKCKEITAIHFGKNLDYATACLNYGRMLEKWGDAHAAILQIEEALWIIEKIEGSDSTKFYSVEEEANALRKRMADL